MLECSFKLVTLAPETAREMTQLLRKHKDYYKRMGTYKQIKKHK